MISIRRCPKGSMLNNLLNQLLGPNASQLSTFLLLRMKPTRIDADESECAIPVISWSKRVIFQFDLTIDSLDNRSA